MCRVEHVRGSLISRTPRTLTRASHPLTSSISALKGSPTTVTAASSSWYASRRTGSVAWGRTIWLSKSSARSLSSMVGKCSRAVDGERGVTEVRLRPSSVRKISDKASWESVSGRPAARAVKSSPSPQKNGTRVRFICSSARSSSSNSSSPIASLSTSPSSSAISPSPSPSSCWRSSVGSTSRIRRTVAKNSGSGSSSPSPSPCCFFSLASSFFSRSPSRAFAFSRERLGSAATRGLVGSRGAGKMNADEGRARAATERTIVTASGSARDVTSISTTDLRIHS
mmetsp:Transcript_54186/g.136346  ORF Transcript_54186/g.136346 Transcript_54186/m.136346 type:complete len:283 (-) Transcript_54186:81-929(-)